MSAKYEERRSRIASSFGAAADYDAHSELQREIARQLAELIERYPLPCGDEPPRIMEIGCGTGHLSELLARRWPAAFMMLTDLSPSMLERCQARLAGLQGERRFTVMDGEAPIALPGSFDLIASSMTFQWFESLKGSVERLLTLLKPGGLLAFATPGAETFPEWREAHRALGLTPGALPFPSEAELLALSPEAEVSCELARLLHRDTREFLRSLKAVGAATPRPGYSQLPVSSLRALMRHLDARMPEGVCATWQILFVSLRTALRKEP